MEAKPDNCCVIDESGMIIEKAPSFPSNIAGDLKDIMAKAKSIFDNEDNLTVEMQNGEKLSITEIYRIQAEQAEQEKNKDNKENKEEKGE